MVLFASFSVTCSVWFLVFMTTAETRSFCRSLTKLWGVLVVATAPVVGVTLYLASSAANAAGSYTTP